MQTSDSPILLNLISLNTGTANSFEIRANTPVITMGRGPTCTVRINDQRCSNTHCRLTLEPENPTQLKVEDLSSNGTFLNNAAIGRGNSLIANIGDVIELLTEKRVGRNQMIAFKIEPASKLKRLAEEETKGNNDKKSKLDDTIGNEIRCKICMEVIHQPVTCMPCLDNVRFIQFCGGCLSDWVSRSIECPNCRRDIGEVKRNHFLNNIVEIYLNSHPNEKRTEIELKSLEAANKFTHDIMPIAKKEINSGDSASSSSESEEEITQQPRRRQVNRGPAVNPAKCRQCTRQVDGFRCVANQQHINCKLCNQFMPERPGVAQKCSVCEAPFCNLYWRTGRKCPRGVRFTLARAYKYLHRHYLHNHPK